MGVFVSPTHDWVICGGAVDGGRWLFGFDGVGGVFIPATADDGGQDREWAARAAGFAGYAILDGCVRGNRTGRVCRFMGAGVRLAGGVGPAGSAGVDLVSGVGGAAGGAAAVGGGDCRQWSARAGGTGGVLDWAGRDECVGVVVVAVDVVSIGGFDCVCGVAVGATGLEGDTRVGSTFPRGGAGVGIYGFQFGVGDCVGDRWRCAGRDWVGFRHSVCRGSMGVHFPVGRVAARANRDATVDRFPFVYGFIYRVLGIKVSYPAKL